MDIALNCVVVDPDPANRQEMAEFLTRHGMIVVASMEAISGLPQILDSAAAPQLALVSLDPTPTESLAAVRPIIRQFPGTDFFVLSRLVEADLLMGAIHAGVKEFIRQPINPDDFMAGVERVAAAHGNSRRARVINVIPTSGGCGATTIACNVAAVCAASAKCVLVDLDLVGGAVATSFDLRPRFSIADLMTTGERLDRQLLDNALAVHPGSGLAIVGRPDVPEDAARVDGPGVLRLLGALSRLFEYVVVDSTMEVDAVHAASLRSADLNVIVTQLNVPSIRNAARLLAAVQRLGVDAGKLRVVANRFAKRGSDIRQDEAERALGMKIAWTIPNDYRSAIEASNLGQPVVLRAPRAEISASLGKLKELLNGRNGAAHEARPTGKH